MIDDFISSFMGGTVMLQGVRSVLAVPLGVSVSVARPPASNAA